MVTKSEGAWVLPVESAIEKLSHPVDKKQVNAAVPEIERVVKLRATDLSGL